MITSGVGTSRSRGARHCVPTAVATATLVAGCAVAERPDALFGQAAAPAPTGNAVAASVPDGQSPVGAPASHGTPTEVAADLTRSFGVTAIGARPPAAVAEPAVPR